MRSRRAPAARRPLAFACLAFVIGLASTVRGDDDEVATRREGEDVVEAGEGGSPFAAPVPVDAQDGQPPPKPAQPVIDHPQVSLTGFGGDYRPVPIDATDIHAALDRRVEEPWDFREATVRQVVDRLRQVLGVPVVLDVTALEDSGIDPDNQSVTAHLAGMTARSALKMLLSQFGDGNVSWGVADEALMVTTAEKSREQLVRVAYPLPRSTDPNSEVAVAAMIDVIHNTVAMETWDVVGGTGVIRCVEVAGEPMLVVAQTCEVHDDVERLLRALHGRGLAEFAGGGPVLRVHPVADDEARADLAKRLKELCNARLGADADPAAGVECVGGTLVVLSKSPLFHALAAQVVAAVAGVERRPQHADDWVGNPFGE